MNETHASADSKRLAGLVYEEGAWGFSYIKRFSFGGLIRNKDYTLAPSKVKTRRPSASMQWVQS